MEKQELLDTLYSVYTSQRHSLSWDQRDALTEAMDIIRDTPALDISDKEK